MFFNNIIKNVYFVKTGTRAGQFLLIINKNKSEATYSILTLPETEALYIPIKEIKNGIKNKILDLVEKQIPNNVFDVCEIVFNKTIKK